MTIFDILKDVLVTKSGKLHEQSDFKKSWSSFMVVRYLSMDHKFIEYADIANKLQLTLSSKQMYLLLTKIIPKQRSSFIKYISKPKKEKKSKD